MSLIARHLETNGVPTMCMASALDIIEAGNPPRVTFLNYPLGHTAGKPFDAQDQYSVISAAALALENSSQQDEVMRLPNLWSDDPSWKEHAAVSSEGDSRQPRDETPQFQREEDRRQAVASGALS